MNRKIYLGIAMLALIAIMAIITVPTMVVAPEGEIPTKTQGITQVEPLRIDLDELSVTKISERSATIKIAFKISNPNPAAAPNAAIPASAI